jgi:hypothetical protein
MPPTARRGWSRRLACAAAFLAGLPGCLIPDRADDFSWRHPPRFQPVPTWKPPAFPHTPPTRPPEIQQVAAQEPAQPKGAQLDVPPGLPGSQAPLPKLPPDTPQTKAARLKAIEELFPALPDLGSDPLVDGEPGTRPVTLDELLVFAKANSPAIVQAAADVE